MPVIKVNDLQHALHPGQNRLGGEDADIPLDLGGAFGAYAVVEVAGDDKAVIRRSADDSSVRVNGIQLVDPTPLIHGDKIEVSGTELYYYENSKVGVTAFVSIADMAALASKRTGTARATTGTGGRLVSLVDGKEYTIGAVSIVIGRDATCDVVVARNEVSRRHAEVGPVENGYEVRDFSANGVYVNGERVETARILSRSDVIRVGGEEFRFYADVATIPPKPVARPAASPMPPAAKPVVVPPRVALAELEVLNVGPTKGERHEIHVPLAHVGRGAHNEIIVADSSMSELHAKFQRRDDGWYLLDAESTNGTYVNGSRVSTERKLKGGDDVRFGGVKMRFQPRDVAGERNADGPALALYDRPKLRPTVPGSSPSVSARPANEQGTSIWIWVVVALGVAGAAAFFLLKH